METVERAQLKDQLGGRCRFRRWLGGNESRARTTPQRGDKDREAAPAPPEKEPADKPKERSTPGAPTQGPGAVKPVTPKGPPREPAPAGGGPRPPEPVRPPEVKPPAPPDPALLWSGL